MRLNALAVLVVIISYLRLSASVPPSNPSLEFSQPDQTIFSNDPDDGGDVKRLDLAMLLDTITELESQIKRLQDTVNEISTPHRPEEEGKSEKLDQEARKNGPGQLRMFETEVKSSLKYKDEQKRIRRASGQSFPPISGSESGCPQPWFPFSVAGGLACPPCATGSPGPPGPPGLPGLPGAMGRDGRDGRDSITRFLKDDVETDVTSSAPRQKSNLSGVIYVRWGRNTCPSTSELVYAGIAGGSFYTQEGSGSNYLCLPREPIYDETESSAHVMRGRIYGGEYQTNTFPPFSELYQHDVPCAVCKASNRHSLLMIPARNACPDGNWTKEYHGYLMSEKSSHHRSEYICVDQNAQAEPRTAGDNNGALFYLVEGICTEGGGLPCGPYINGYELTCAVCTM